MNPNLKNQNDQQKAGVAYCKDIEKQKQETGKPTPEMPALVANYVGEVKQIPLGKRTRRGPSKKPGVSGSLQGHWTEKQDRLVWGDQ